MLCRLRLDWCHAQRGGSERPKIYYQSYPILPRHLSSYAGLTPIQHSGRGRSRLALNEAFRPNYVGRTHDLDLSAAGIHQAPFVRYLDALRLR